MENYDNDDNDKSLEREFTEAVKMLEEKHKLAHDQDLMNSQPQQINTDLKAEILELKQEIERMKARKPQLELTLKNNVFYAKDLDWPVCYNCSIREAIPIVITLESPGIYCCANCRARYLYDPTSTDPIEKINMFGSPD